MANSGKVAAAAAVGGGIAGLAAGGALAGLLFPGVSGGLGVSLLTAGGYMAGTFLASQLFPQNTDMDMPPLARYPVQTSDKGNPIHVVYGTVRKAGNMAWFGASRAVAVKSSAGGGSGGGGQEDVTSITWRRSFFIGVCEGEGDVLRIWEGKTEISLTNVTVYKGDGNAGLAAVIGEDFTNWKNLCGVWFPDWNTGTSEAIPNFNMEVSTAGSKFRSTYVTRDGDMQILDNAYADDSTVNVAVGAFRIDMQASGRELALNNCGNSTHPVQRYLIDSGVVDNTHYTDSPEETFGMDCSRGLAYTSDGKYLYVLTDLPNFVGLSTYCRVVMYNVESGLPVWRSDAFANPQNWGSGIDSGDDFYVKDTSGADGVRVFSTDGSWRKIAAVVGKLCTARRIIVVPAAAGDLTSDRIFIGGQGDVSSGNYSITTIDDDGVGTVVKTWKTTAGVSTFIGDMVWFNGSLYVTTQSSIKDTDGNGPYSLWKFNSNLSFQAGYDTGAGLAGIWIDWRDKICVHNANNTVSIFDESLNLQETHTVTLTDGIFGAHALSMPRWWTISKVRDENPEYILRDLYTHTRYGARQPSTRLHTATWLAVNQYCQINDLLISMTISSRRPYLHWAERVRQHFDGFLFWSGDFLKLGAWKDDLPVGVLGEGDWQEATTDDPQSDGVPPPIQIKKRSKSDTYNRIEVAYLNRSDEYGPSIAVAEDEVDQDTTGKVKTLSIELEGVTRGVLAQKLAYRFLIDNMYRFGTYVGRLGFKGMLYEVGDVLTISDGYQVVNQRVRVTSISESQYGANRDLEMMDDIAALYPAIGFIPENTLNPDTTAAVLAQGIICSREDVYDRLLYLAITPQSATTSGWYIYMSRDNITFDFLGRTVIDGVTGGDANSYGTLASTMPAHKSIIHKWGESFDVSIGTITDLNTGVTEEQFFRGLSLAKIGSEIIGFKTVQESAVEGVWQIRNVIRGMFNTDPVAHEVGEVFCTLRTDFTVALSEADIAQPVYFKAVAFYGNDGQTVDNVTATTITFRGEYRKPAPTSMIRIRGREGFTDIQAYPATIDFYLTNRRSGFNANGVDSVLWDEFTPDTTLQGVNIRLLDAAGAEILQQYESLRGYGADDYEIVLADSDRAGNDPIEIELKLTGYLPSDARESPISLVT